MPNTDTIIENQGAVVPNLRVQRVKDELVANGGSMANAIRKAGYKETYARNPQKIKKTRAFQQATKSIVDQLEDERQAALIEMRKKRAKAKYRDLTDGVDKFTKNIQLLKGKPTERYAHDLSTIPADELRARITLLESADVSEGTGEKEPA